MKKINDGGPAFPTTGISALGSHEHDGMSLRDYFAAKAMSAIIIGYAETEIINDIADNAYQMADAMIEAREK